jgi:hypothetical protein
MEEAPDLSKLWGKVTELRKEMIGLLKGRELMIFKWILVSFIS